jgi:hypothetical protein
MPIAIVVLAAGLSVALNHWVIAPKKATLASQEATLKDLQDKAAKLNTALQQLAEVTKQWKEAQAKVQHFMEIRSIPLSFYMPIEAMITLAYEYRHDLGPVMTKWLESTGCQIASSISLPAPPGTPPAPSSGFYPLGQNIAVTVRGTMDQIRALYESLDKCPRILTLTGFSLRPERGDLMSASFTLSAYLLVESPPGAAAPAAGAPGGGAPGGGAPGMGGGMPGGSGMGGPGMGGSGMGPGAPKGAPSAAPKAGSKAGGEDDMGGGGGLKSRKNLGGGEE